MVKKLNIKESNNDTTEVFDSYHDFESWYAIMYGEEGFLAPKTFWMYIKKLKDASVVKEIDNKYVVDTVEARKYNRFGLPNIPSWYVNDAKVIRTAFPLEGYADWYRDEVLEVLIKFVRELLQIPNNYNLSIAEYLYNETGEIGGYNEVDDFLADFVRDIDIDDYHDEYELRCLSYLKYGDSRLTAAY